MKNAGKLFSVAILCLIVACFLPVSVFANSPAPADSLGVTLSNLPDDAVYADLLIKISENDPNFVDFQPNDLVNDPQAANEIVEYSSDGYRSFTFHYKDAMSNITLQHLYNEIYSVDFCRGSEYREYLTQYENLRKHYNDIKIALLDENFKIILVSNATQLPEEDDFLVFSGRIHYNALTNSFKTDTRIDPFYIILAGFFTILMILLSVGVEVFLSRLLQFKGKQVILIFIVNVSSQIIMRVLYAVLPFTYLIETVILEILVYGAEFLIYRKSFKEISTAKIVSYTVMANTVSLLIGIVLDCYILV